MLHQALFRQRPALVWLALLKDWQLVVRCIAKRGPEQARCLCELDRRGLQLSASQRSDAGLPPRGVWL